MNVNPTVAVALIALLGSVYSAYLTYKNSKKANDTSARKVSVEEFEAQQDRYRKLVEDQEKIIERLQRQMDRLNEQLAREQDASNTLREMVRGLQKQIDEFQTRHDALLRELAIFRHSVPPPAPSPP